MELFITGFISGIVSCLAVYIFIWTYRRGKGGTAGTLTGRVDTNNIDTGRGIEKLRANNQESGRIVDEAKGTASEGLKTIDDTKRAVSDIIKAARRDKEKEPD